MGRRGAKTASSCPCGSGDPYSRCCRRQHLGEAAPTAEALMRSRYSAFAKRLPAYLLDTWHPTTRPPNLDIDPDLRWTGLRVLATVAGTIDDDTGTVEFEADHVSPGGAGTLHELSRFERVDGRWFYLDGV